MSALRINHLTSRYELEENNHTVFANYQLQGQTVVILHVEAPMALRGTGAAGRLMELIAKDAAEKQQKIKPICSYALTWLQRHKEYQPLLVA